MLAEKKKTRMDAQLEEALWRGDAVRCQARFWDRPYWRRGEARLYGGEGEPTVRFFYCDGARWVSRTLIAPYYELERCQ